MDSSEEIAIIMGKQINFYAIDEDYDDLLKLAEDKGLLALKPMVPAAVYEAGIKPVPPLSFRGRQASLRLIPQEIGIDEIVYVPTEDHRDFLIDSRTSPIIRFSAGYRQANDVYHGRFYIYSSGKSPHLQLITKYYEKLARYIRKNWTKHPEYPFYIGPHTRKISEQEHLEFAP